MKKLNEGGKMKYQNISFSSSGDKGDIMIFYDQFFMKTNKLSIKIWKKTGRNNIFLLSEGDIDSVDFLTISAIDLTGIQ